MRKQRKYVAYKAQVQLHIVYEYKEKRVPFTGYARTVAYVARAQLQSRKAVEQVQLPM
jgi:hypothetical protein